MPFVVSLALELAGMFTVWVAVPALRAGLADAVPAHLRGAGFGAFNLVSIVFGAAAAPIIVGALADVFNLRIAFLLVSPPVFLGAYVLYRARDHLDADAAKIFEAVVRAMQQDQERSGP
jgi:MFS family permease